MCGILGFFNYEGAEVSVVKALYVIKNRGLDGVGIATEKELIIKKSVDELKNTKIKNTTNIIGHNLHSVVNLLPQPIVKNDSRFAINCEIYNWEELNARYGFGAKNDSELVFMLLEKNGAEKIVETLDELDGVYAFIYWKEDSVIVARDIIGEKPIWFCQSDNLAISSEKKALLELGLTNIEELNPRLILNYDISKKKIEIIKRDFFETTPEHKESKEKMMSKTEKLLLESIEKRVPKRKFGVLFSGGVDSTFLAYNLKKLGHEFTCYTSGLEGENMPEDVVVAKKVAKELGLELKYKLIKLDEVEDYLKKVVPLIEDTNVVKVGVALTFYVACEMAREDNVKVIFSGLGSEEIFAGYERHKKSIIINEECLAGLRKMYERDLYRDDVITMNHNIELRLPFLDTELVDYALKIPARYKLDEKENKKMLREIAIKQGIPKEFAYRKKRAAQYGSRFDNALIRLARKNKSKYRSEYLKRFYPYPNLKIAALISGGKDSFYAMHLLQRQNYEISCLVSIQSDNPDSYMYHTPNIELVKLQAEACQIPLIIEKTKGNKEEELVELENALLKAKKEYGIQGVCSGALFSNYQRERIEKICDKLGLKIFSPLWHMDQELELRNLIDEGFEVILSSIAADGLDRTWLGKVLTQKDIDKLVNISKKIGLNPAGEGGEFESFVINAPFFKKRINIKKSKIVTENEYTGKYLIEKAELK